MTALLEQVRAALAKNQAATQATVIQRLNLILLGWAMYHRHVVAAATFGTIDHQVWVKLWRWAKRRHPNKSSQWVKARYFERHGSRDWVFGCSNGTAASIAGPTLFYLTSLPIEHHKKIRFEANPFDPAWAYHFQGRSRA